MSTSCDSWSRVAQVRRIGECTRGQGRDDVMLYGSPVQFEAAAWIHMDHISKRWWREWYEEAKRMRPTGQRLGVQTIISRWLRIWRQPSHISRWLPPPRWRKTWNNMNCRTKRLQTPCEVQIDSTAMRIKNWFNAPRKLQKKMKPYKSRAIRDSPERQ